MEEILTTLSNIKNVAGDIILVFFLCLFAYMFIFDTIDIFKMIAMVLRVYRNKNKSNIIKHINFLLRVKGEFIEKVTSFEYIHTSYSGQLDSIIKKYTTVSSEANEHGVKTKLSTKYYTDLQKACVDSKEQLNVLAFSIALEVVQDDLTYQNLNKYVIVGQSGGNVLLANRVANILGLRFAIVGTLAGKDASIFGSIGKGDRALLIDDILFTGGMLTETISILEDNLLPCDKIFVVLKRSTVYQERLSQVCIKYDKEIHTISVKTILDADMNKMFE